MKNVVIGDLEEFSRSLPFSQTPHNSHCLASPLDFAITAQPNEKEP